MGSEIDAEKDFATRKRAFEELDKATGGDGYSAEVQGNNSLGQNILREEIGYFGPYEGPRYDLDERTRNLLIAHTRQDVASAYACASSAFREAHRARKSAERAALLALGILILNVVILTVLIVG